jgi:hypothetical protein
MQVFSFFAGLKSCAEEWSEAKQTMQSWSVRGTHSVSDAMIQRERYCIYMLGFQARKKTPPLSSFIPSSLPLPFWLGKRFVHGYVEDSCSIIRSVHRNVVENSESDYAK